MAGHSSIIETETFLRITRERAAPKIDFQSCAASGIRFAYFAPSTSLPDTEDSTRTEIRRRCSQIKRNAGSERDREPRRLAKVENGRSEFRVKETKESKSPDRPWTESMFNASNRLKRRTGSPFHAATVLYSVYSSY